MPLLVELSAVTNKPTLAVVFGDQLSDKYPAALGLDRQTDTILMVEVRGASEAPPSHVQRTVLFLSAMRHFAEQLTRDGWNVDYVALTDPGEEPADGNGYGRSGYRRFSESV